MEPTYFATQHAFRQWLAQHAATHAELIVGFMKLHTGAPSLTWPQAVDEALCVGWIDGVRHRVDDQRYKIRFTPRRAGSHWSAVNIARMEVLLAEGRVGPEGLAAFARRSEEKSRRAAYEQPEMPTLSASEIKHLQSNAQAWAYFESLPLGYLKRVIWWVVSAKKDATRHRRMAALVEACAAARRL